MLQRSGLITVLARRTMVAQLQQRCLLLRPASSVLLLIAVAAQLLLSSIPAASAARIVVYAYPWASCAFDLVAVSQELAQRGHAVLLITPRELDDKVVNMLTRGSTAEEGQMRSCVPATGL